MTGRQRQQLKVAISEKLRERLRDDGLCAHCLEQLPDGAHPQQRYCNKSCRGKADHLRQKRAA